MNFVIMQFVKNLWTKAKSQNLYQIFWLENMTFELALKQFIFTLTGISKQNINNAGVSSAKCMTVTTSGVQQVDSNCKCNLNQSFTLKIFVLEKNCNSSNSPIFFLKFFNIA